MTSLKITLLASAWALCAVTGVAQPAYTPKPGSVERKAIMDPACERDVGQKVIFRVQHLRLIGEWALARVVPLRPDGSEIDYAKTKDREANEEGAFDGDGAGAGCSTGRGCGLAGNSGSSGSDSQV